jgi:hypothetical protein
MQEALKEYSQMSQMYFEQEFNKKIVKLESNPSLLIGNSSNINAEFMFINPSFNLNHSERVNIKCRNCSENICKGSEIKLRDTNYVCDHQTLIEKVKVNKEKFNCPKATCNNELGRLMQLRNSMPLFMIDIKGIKFEIPGLGVQIISKWSKVKEHFFIQAI